MWMKNALLASEERVFSQRRRRVRGKVLYYADNAMLTMRSSAQIYVWRWQGAEEYVLKSSFLLLYIFFFFGFFCFLDQINTARGLNVGMTVRDDEEW
jgi:hypothetical protein